MHCRQCLQDKPPEAFYAGRTARCKSCTVALQVADRRLTPRQREFMHLLRIKPLSVPELAALADLGEQRTAEVLRSLRKLGLAAPSAEGGYPVLWAPPAVAAAIRAQRNNDLRERRAAAARARAARQRDAERTAARLAADQPRPIPSVFHLAA